MGRNFDWYMRMCDDTYIFMDNLRLFLSDHDPNRPIQFGSYFQHYLDGYLSSGSGFVLSRATFSLLMDNFNNNSLCKVKQQVLAADDVELGACLRNLKAMQNFFTYNYAKFL